ncbi:MAG TPA: AI-2E family transporter [Longimicrobium sp.]|nr:AI-2E family transporter [Longimicrobium sp.]
MAFLQTRRQRAAALVAALGIAIAIALTPFATGLLGAVVLAVICAPVHRRLAGRIPPRLSAILVLTGALVLVLMPLAVVAGVVVKEAPGVVEALRANADRLSTLQVAGVDVGAQLSAAAGTAVGWLSQQAFAFFGSAAKGTLSLVIAFFGLYYLLLYPAEVWRAVREFLPFSDTGAEVLRERFHRVTQATLLGALFTALIQGSLVGFGFWILGLPNAAFWAVITGIVSVLPMLGSSLVWFPGVVVLALSERWGAALTMAVIGVIAANADNVVRLIVYKKVSDIHPMVTLVGAFAGLKYFGLLGVLLGPLAIAYFFELIKIYRSEFIVPADGASPAPADALAAAPAVIQAPD